MLLPCLWAKGESDSVLVQEPAEDYVRAYVVVAEPGERIYSSTGHACLRMECPSVGLDNIFSYEGENASDNIRRFFAGDLMMRVVRIKTEDYIAQYKAEGRGVKCYELHLPIQKKLLLWEMMDNRVDHLQPLPYDFLNRSCAVSVFDWIMDVADKDSLRLGTWNELATLSRKEIGGLNIADEWNHFIACTIVGGESYDTSVAPERKVIVPTELVRVLQGATYGNHPLIASSPIVLNQSSTTSNTHWFTPLVLAIILLVLAFVGFLFDITPIRIALLIPHVLLGCLITYLVCFSQLPCTQWNWLIIPFNPLPALFWHYRQRWCNAYALLCLVWIIGILLYPHKMVDAAHIVLTIAFAINTIDRQLIIDRTTKNQRQTI